MSAPRGHIISRRWPVEVFSGGRSSAPRGTPARQPGLSVTYWAGDARCRVEIRRDTADGNGRSLVVHLDFDQVGGLISVLQHIAPRMPAQDEGQ